MNDVTLTFRPARLASSRHATVHVIPRGQGRLCNALCGHATVGSTSAGWVERPGVTPTCKVCLMRAKSLGMIA